MELSMRKLILRLSVAATLATGAGKAAATDLNVNFTANVLETTCQMKLMGGTGSDTKQELTIGTNGQVRLDAVKAGTAAAPFQIAIVECPSSLQSLKATVKGDASGYLFTGLKNQILPTSGGSNYSAVEIARQGATDAPFLINSTEDAKRLVWTPAEISTGKVDLIATLRETQTDKMTTGAFRGIATFEFSYE
ncbi:fimbrial protein [Enterobacter pseudoroggenkampii]|uniref:fimbrial protein n=1 Tax=Enterobacter pseudoroggenkampii TaxID=2996112 RepID=UPI0038B238BF